ncbi:CesD/SycD/LcrH family type III secretion system chaperone, partial [Yersinia enterocolitica]|nr:CesD/SycD/LcrH family type III secretion system chaperone [Yersinia enterocolitica]
AESGLFLAQELIANKPEFKELSTRVSSMLEAIKLKKEMEHECVDNP